jgi:hypothetical protein
MLGVTVLQAGILDVLKPQPGARVLGYAAIFGFAQQALTRQLDIRANSLLGAAESTNPTVTHSQGDATPAKDRESRPTGGGASST